jgi:hypothetical protein
MKVSLIDADSIIHIVAYHNGISSEMIEMLDDSDEESKESAILALYESKDKQAVLDHVSSFVNDILNKTEATHYLGFLGDRKGSDTFRHKLAVTKPYKGTRGKTPHWTKYWKPIIIEHLVSEWKFIELSNIESDDACSIMGHYYKDKVIDYVICSPDKDLKQIPGSHYDYKKCEFVYVDDYNALKNLYRQLLKGDQVDALVGCPGVGEKSPHMEFPNCTTEDEFRDYAYEVYKSKKSEGIFNEQFNLVYMLRILDCIDLQDYPEAVERKVIGEVTEEFKQETVVVPVFIPIGFSQ